MEPYLGEIAVFAFNTLPKGWAFCNGQLLQIAQGQALFSLIGTIYGGDGQKTFGLPNLQGRVPIHAGQGAGLGPYQIGQLGGAEGVTLTLDQMAAHSHSATCSKTAGNNAGPGAAQWAGTTLGDSAYSTDKTNGEMGPGCIQPAGNGEAHPNLMPSLVLNFAIALIGNYPSRN